jgi:hypothetical protein
MLGSDLALELGDPYETIVISLDGFVFRFLLAHRPNVSQARGVFDAFRPRNTSSHED